LLNVNSRLRPLAGWASTAGKYQHIVTVLPGAPPAEDNSDINSRWKPRAGWTRADGKYYHTAGDTTCRGEQQVTATAG
jgi:roadblock/LC7 domain-containing protein